MIQSTVCLVFFWFIYLQYANFVVVFMILIWGVIFMTLSFQNPAVSSLNLELCMYSRLGAGLLAHETCKLFGMFKENIIRWFKLIWIVSCKCG